MDNLWPEDIFDNSIKIRPPVQILKEQASIFNERSKKIVVAEVVSVHITDASKFGFMFKIKAPALNNYSFSLFYVIHKIELYPVSLTIDEEFYKGNGGELKKDSMASDEQEFNAILRDVFTSQKLKKIISAILAQSQK